MNKAMGGGEVANHGAKAAGDILQDIPVHQGQSSVGELVGKPGPTHSDIAILHGMVCVCSCTHACVSV